MQDIYVVWMLEGNSHPNLDYSPNDIGVINYPGFFEMDWGACRFVEDSGQRYQLTFEVVKTEVSMRALGNAFTLIEENM